MGAIHVHEFMTLDGVIDAPTWTFEYGFDPQMGETLAAITASSTGILLGRNDVPDVRAGLVVAHGRGRSRRAVLQRHHQVRRVGHAERGDVAQLGDPRRLRRRPDRQLKNDVDGDIYVSGSIQLVRAMLADGLIDELDLFVYPLTLGSGPRLFAEGDAPSKLALKNSQAYANGVVHLAYGPVS